MEHYYNDCLTSKKTERIFNAITYIEGLQTRLYKYQGEILQLAGVSEDWRRTERVSKDVSVLLKCLQDLGYAVAVNPDDAESLHRSKELMYQTSFVDL